MIHYTHTPLPCVFSKNPVNFEVFAANYSIETNVFPFLRMIFVYKMLEGRFLEFKFTNPNTLEEETINFIGSSSPSKDGKSIPATTSTLQLVDNDYMQMIADFMRANQVLSSYYEIKVNGFEIDVVAKQGIKELVPNSFYTNVSFLPNPTYVFGGVSQAYWRARKRQGHTININIYFEKEYLSNEFELVSAQSDTVDADGFQNIDINSILDSEIKNSFATPPLPEITDPSATNIIQKANVLRRYYIETSEQWTNMQQPIEWVKSDIFHVHFGGVSMDDFARDNPFNYLQSERMALTWWRNKKRIYPEQSDWMSVMNVTKGNDIFETELELLYKDGTTDTFNIGTQDLSIWETITIPVGYNQLDIDNKQNALKEVYGWKIIVSGTDGEVANRTYLLHSPQNFTTNTIVYLNSFGVAESFVCSGFFENNLTTSTDIASKTLKHDYKSINGRDFVFNKSSKNTFKARSGVLNKQEAKALQTMLNVAPVFILENDLLRPIIIEAGNYTIDDQREITQTLDLKITKSLELTNVSDMRTKPTLTVKEHCGMFTVFVNSEYKVDNYGDLTTTKGSEPFDTTVFDGQKYELTEKAEDDAIYFFSCEVTVEGETFSLSSTYAFKRDTARISATVRRPTTSIYSFGISSRVEETIRFNSQSNIDTEITTAPTVVEIASLPITKGANSTVISASCLSNILFFYINSEPFSKFEFGKMTKLEAFYIVNCSLSGHFSSATFKTLQWFNLMSNNIESIELGMNLDLHMLNLENNSLDKIAIEKLIKELYDYRKLFTKKYDPLIHVHLVGNPGSSQIGPDAIDMKNGTGSYAGDGLIQNQIIIYL